MSQSTIDSPSSPGGVQRSHRSPRRYTPYDSGSHGSRSRSENWTPAGASQSGDFNTQYMQYSGPSESYQRAPFATLQNHEQSGRLPALTTVVSVDELSTQFGLSKPQRKAAHSFCKLSNDDRGVVSFMHLLRTEQQYDEIQGQLKDMQHSLEAIGAFCTEAWKPSEHQLKLLRSLLRHYIIGPVTSYSKLVPLVETYIHDHARRLHLQLYKQDPTVKVAIHKLLGTENNALRSAFRKLVFTSVKDKTTLMDFSKKIISTHHLPTLPAIPPTEIMACLALMRQVARPLMDTPVSQGGNTKFWSSLEKALDDLFIENGNERDNSSWQQWEVEVINTDNARYNRFAAGANARTQAQIDAAVLGPNAAAHTASALNNDVDDDSEQDTQNDREVNISALGNLAALSNEPVVRA